MAAIRLDVGHGAAGEDLTIELKLFSDLINALGKMAGGLKATINLPKAKREAMCRSLDETYRLIEATLKRVIIQIQLDDILLQTTDDDFLRETVK